MTPVAAQVALSLAQVILSPAQAVVYSLVAALVAAALSFASNRVSRRMAGPGAVVFVAPGFEESFKTGAALLIGAPVLPAHVAFGLIEAVYDLALHLRATANPVPGTAEASLGGDPSDGPSGELGRGLGAAAAGLLGHTLFGAITVGVFGHLGSWPLGVGSAYLVHVGWNALVMGRLTRRHG